MAYSKRKLARRSRRRRTAGRRRGNKSYRGFKRGGDYPSPQSYQDRPYASPNQYQDYADANNEPPEYAAEYEDVVNDNDVPVETPDDVWNDAPSVDEGDQEYESPSTEVPVADIPDSVPVVEIPSEKGWLGKMYDTVNIFKGGKTRRRNKKSKSKRRRGSKRGSKRRK